MNPSTILRSAFAAALATCWISEPNRASADAPASDPAALVESAPMAESITEAELGAHLEFLASDLMRGRDTASPEIKIASEYLMTRLKMFGAEPAGDPDLDGNPTYFAHFPLEFNTPEIEGTELVLTLGEGDDAREHILKVTEDFVFVPRGIAAGEIEAPIVFLGFGRAGAGDDPNDFDAIDVEGKIVLVLDGLPKGEDDEGEQPARRTPRGGAGNSFTKLQEARERGALALIVVHPFDAEAPPSFSETNPFATRMFGRRSMSLGSSPTAPTGTTPLLFVEDDARDAIDEDLKLSDDPETPRGFGEATARFVFKATVEPIRERNVIGMFPGSDDDLKHEVVIYSAHYDHVGVTDGEIYNGSDDNGSGTSGLIEIAQAIGEGPRPRRTVAFLWVSGEEKGLLGSRWWSENQTLPEGFEIVANINIDMISRNDPEKVSITPSREHPDYSTIIPAAVTAIDSEGMTPMFDADQFYARTDSFNFARLGIPIIFFFTGVHEDYHKPGDVFEKADLAKAVRISRAAYRLGWALAQDDDRPRVIPADAEDEAPGETADEKEAAEVVPDFS